MILVIVWIHHLWKLDSKFDAMEEKIVNLKVELDEAKYQLFQRDVPDTWDESVYDSPSDEPSEGPLFMGEEN